MEDYFFFPITGILAFPWNALLRLPLPLFRITPWSDAWLILSIDIVGGICNALIFSAAGYWIGKLIRWVIAATAHAIEKVINREDS